MVYCDEELGGALRYRGKERLTHGRWRRREVREVIREADAGGVCGFSSRMFRKRKMKRDEWDWKDAAKPGYASEAVRPGCLWRMWYGSEGRWGVDAVREV